MGAPAMRELGSRDVHVWHASLPVPVALASACRRLLSADERDREARTLAALARETFVVGRGMLRALIGAYLVLPPREVVFAYTALGRPWLALAGDRPPLQFSVSHSAGQIAIGFARDSRLGVDIERVRATADCDAISARFFAPSEQGALAALSGVARTSAFFACWTRKEAVLKAAGFGISGGLKRVEVTCGSSAPARIIKSEAPEIDPGEWTLIDLPAPAGYRAALAVSMNDPVVSISEIPASVVLAGERTYNSTGSLPPDSPGPLRGHLS